MKVVLNRTVGGFGVSSKVLCRLHELGSEAAKAELDLISEFEKEDQELITQLNSYPLFEIDRADPLLVQAVEELHDTVPHLEIVEIPNNIEYYVHSNEMGIESVHEKHRIWPEE